MTAPAPQDPIIALIERAKEAGLEEQVFALLGEYRKSLQLPVQWHREAGRALASEGLDTDVLRVEIDRWLDRERLALAEKLKGLLGEAQLP